jgi:hypothetical protein
MHILIFAPTPDAANEMQAALGTVPPATDIGQTGRQSRQLPETVTHGLGIRG